MRIYHYRWMLKKVMTVIKYSIVFPPLITVLIFPLRFSSITE